MTATTHRRARAAAVAWTLAVLAGSITAVAWGVRP